MTGWHESPTHKDYLIGAKSTCRIPKKYLPKDLNVPGVTANVDRFVNILGRQGETDEFEEAARNKYDIP